MSEQIPDGYMQNAQGHLVPTDSIQALDLLRNDLVEGIVNSATILQKQMRTLKTAIMDDISAFIDIAAEQYSTKIGGRKGNLSLTTYDGKYKLMLAVNDTITFDERLQIAKQLIDECIHEWTKNSNSNIRALIEHAFQTDKAGNINTGRVFSLFKLKIDDHKWQRAMEALKDSISVASSKSYIRLYERIGDDGKYQQIPMDLSAL
jgi:hypothetical protein